MERLPGIRRAVAALGVVLAIGTAGYMLLGFGFLDALYQTVTTVTSVGFGEVQPLGPTGQIFTMALILVGVGTAFYALGAVLEGVFEGVVRTHVGRRRMDRTISRTSGHVIVCGWGRVGSSSRQYLRGTGLTIVAVDRDPARLVGDDELHVLGDVTDDDVLAAAGIDRAYALIAALDTDADNVFVTLSARWRRPDMVIIARARDESSMAKLVRAGADRVVNPQLMGGRRMAAFALQPHVADFLDVVMHDDELDYRLEQVEIEAHALQGRTLRDIALHGRTGALLLAFRTPDGRFLANPDQTTPIGPGAVLIVLGTPAQLACVRRLARARARTVGSAVGRPQAGPVQPLPTAPPG